MDSWRGEGTAPSAVFRCNGHCTVRSLEGDQGYSVVLTFSADGQFGDGGGCYFVSFSSFVGGGGRQAGGASEGQGRCKWRPTGAFL